MYICQTHGIVLNIFLLTKELFTKFALFLMYFTMGISIGIPSLQSSSYPQIFFLNHSRWEQ